MGVTPRCVLDSASESSFLTLHAAERLGLDKIKTDFTVQGLNSSSAKINYLTRASVSNSDQTFNLNVNMFLTTEIIKVHPSKKINISDLVIPQGIVLADEGFNQLSEISCLIGSEHFFDIFGTKQIRVPNSNFRLIDSKFGYVVTGSYIDEPCYFNHCFLSKGHLKHLLEIRFASCLFNNMTSETVEVARVFALRLPPFWKSNVSLWIAQCDHAFTFSGISSDDTKYSALVANLDAETLSYVSDIVLSPSEQ
ncbi:DUF1758 domain-containing protein [Trichonephila clavipes]|nr:DUF1758 domain-containing protein [Trichonephila clavipes]